MLCLPSRGIFFPERSNGFESAEQSSYSPVWHDPPLMVNRAACPTLLSVTSLDLGAIASVRNMPEIDLTKSQTVKFYIYPEKQKKPIPVYATLAKPFCVKPHSFLRISGHRQTSFQRSQYINTPNRPPQGLNSAFSANYYRKIQIRGSRKEGNWGHD